MMNAKKVLALLLAVLMLVGLLPAAFAAEEEAVPAESVELAFTPADGTSNLKIGEEAEEEFETIELNKIVRVSIFVDGASVLDAGYSPDGIAANASAKNYRNELKAKQAKLTSDIEAAIGGKLDVQWNLTLATNAISANVRAIDIEKIEAVPGVARVIRETLYDAPAPVESDDEVQTITSGSMIGSGIAYANGYTGAGSKVAIIDTGVDDDHQSFSGAGLEYSLQQNAAAAGKTYEEYVAGLNLLTPDSIDAVADQLNAPVTGETGYVNMKIGYGYNYVDKNFTINHDSDSQGEHGSHVTGISTANKYIPNEEDGFDLAEETVFVKGVAPDAQIITMKVFGAGGGAYDSDYMVAIEDAIVLGADSVNLSLGSAAAGFVTSDGYQNVMDSLTEHGVVVVMSAGNAYNWPYADNIFGGGSGTGYLFNDEVNLDTVGSPGSFTNTLAVASIDNAGFIGYKIDISGIAPAYSETAYTNATIGTLDTSEDKTGTTYDFIYVNGVGQESDFTGLDITGKVVLCNRGTTSFYEKHAAVQAAGGIACIVVNNQAGTINMDLSSGSATIPCISILQADGLAIKAASVPVYTDETEETVAYWKGTFTCYGKKGPIVPASEYYTMSAFSSTGVPGSLTLKPEITAPGGNIYSVNGAVAGGKEYENMSGTSMAAPQVSGMVAVAAQYFRDTGLAAAIGKTPRQLAISLLMSTSEPVLESDTEYYYSILKQGSGLANIGNVVSAKSYIWMNENATASYADGKVKAELGDDPERTGVYSFGFTLNNFSAEPIEYKLDADFFTQQIFSDSGYFFMDTWTWALDGALSFTVDGAEAESVTVAGGASAEITVSFAIAEEDKEFLDEYYPSGAYVEGYVYVTPVSSGEGLIPDVEHSIPVLAFYGNWSDASMFDCANYHDYLYDADTMSHLALTNSNVLSVLYPNAASATMTTGNPYAVEDTYPVDKLAMSNDVTLVSFKYSLIRNVAALAAVVTDEEGNVLYMSSLKNNCYAAFRNTTTLAWQGTSATVPINLTIGDLELDEGDRINVSVVAVPEYYGTSFTAETLKELIESGTLGKGAFLTESYFIDNTPPEALAVSKDLLTGNLTISATDNCNVAYIAVTNKAGTLLYSGSVPTVDENGIATATVDLEGLKLPSEIAVMVADYAGNETLYNVKYKEGSEDMGGAIYAYNYHATYRGGKGWLVIDKDNLYWQNSTNNGGTAFDSRTINDVTGAAYVDGFVYSACTDGYLYVAPINDLGTMTKVGKYSTTAGLICDMAYDASTETLYALDGANTVYSINTLTGALTEAYNVNTGASLVTLAIDDDGNFYSASYGKSGSSKLYTWTSSMAEDGIVTVEAGATVSGLAVYTGSTAAWDNTNNVMLLANNAITNTALYQTNNFLSAVDVTTGAVTKFGTESGASNNYRSKLYVKTGGLFVVPKTKSAAGGSDAVSAVELSDSVVEIIKGSTYTLTADVYPWTVTDKSVTWTSADETVATVDENGVVSALKAGTTIITAASVADSAVTASCRVFVKTVNWTIYGLLQGTDGKLVDFSYDLANDPTWQLTQPVTGYGDDIANVCYDWMNDTIYSECAGGAIYNVDPLTGEATALAGSGSLGFAVDDMAVSYLSEAFGVTDHNPVPVAVYSTYLLVEPNGISGAFTGSAFNLSTYFNSTYGYGTGIAWGGIDMEQEVDEETEELITTYSDVFYSITSNGYIYVFYLDTDLSLGLARIGTDLGKLDYLQSSADNYDCSLVVGDDMETMFYAAFDGERSHLYMLTPDAELGIYHATYLGDFGDDVWPVTLYFAEQKDEEHDYEIYESVAPTCAEAGYDAYVCKNCGATYIDPVAPTGHDYQLTGSTEATCLEAGTATYTCSKCNDTYTENTDDALGHDYQLTATVPATCLEDGLETYTCSRCNDSYDVVLTAPGHTEEEIPAIEPTCTEVGYTAGVKCSVCGEILTEPKMIEAAGHDWDEGVITTTPTCEGVGVRTYTCKTCGEHKLEALAPTGHTEVPVEAVAPTCTEIGYTAGTKCSVCGAILSGIDVVPAKGHNVVVDEKQEPTCTETGLSEGCHCDVCGKVIIAQTVIDPKGHLDVIDPAVEPTCTDTGLTEGTHCAICGVITLAQTTLDAKGHTEVVDPRVEPNCVMTGLSEGKHCTVCGKVTVEQTVLEAKGHTEVIDEAVEPTCTKSGLTAGSHCSVCGKILAVQKPVDPKGHTVVILDAVAPTCTETGLTAGAYCSVCGTDIVKQQKVAALGHNYVDEITEPTCTEYGFTTHTCSVCGNTYVDAITEAAGHSYASTIIKEPTETAEGEIEFVCEVCGDTYTEAIPAAVCPSADYADVDQTMWYHEAVDFVLENGYMYSTSEDALTFEPLTKVTRAGVVDALYRVAGSPAAEYKGTFTDVVEDNKYAAAIEWAAANSIAAGKGDGKFDPDGLVTRQELAVFMYKMSELQGKDVSAKADLSKFADAAKVPSWAKSYLEWAVAVGIVSGKASGGKTYLAPTDNAMRAEYASILMRFV